MKRIIAAISIVVLLSAAQPCVAASSMFDMTETISSNLRPFPKWTGVLQRASEQGRAPDSECGRRRFHPCSVVQWRSMLGGMRGDTLRRQMDRINEWGNAHPYIEDIVNWGVQDYWDTPYEFLDVSGDCEDYAITKYYSLRALGVPASAMRVIIVQDLNLGGIIHAILGVYDNGRLYILDNQSPRVMEALSIYHYRPIYGVNETAWWQYRPR